MLFFTKLHGQNIEAYLVSASREILVSIFRENHMRVPLIQAIEESGTHRSKVRLDKIDLFSNIGKLNLLL